MPRKKEDLGDRTVEYWVPDGGYADRLFELLEQKGEPPESDPVEVEKPKPTSAAAIEALLGKEGKKILVVARDSNLNADDKLRAICGIDRAMLAWDSSQLAELLGCTAAAIRKTKFWKEDRQKAIEAS